MALNIENASGVPLEIDDFSITLETGEIIDLATRIHPVEVVQSANGGDLDTLITSGDISVKDPIDGTTSLSVADGLATVRAMNEPHWRLGVGARIGDISDVDVSGASIGDILQLGGGGSWAPTSLVVDGPASSTDDALVRFDGATGKLIQNSLAILDDLGALSGLTQLTINSNEQETRVQINTSVFDDNGKVYDSDALLVTHQTPTSETVLNDPKDVLYLARQGTSGQAFGAFAAFKLSRYEDAFPNSRTRLDIDLAHESFDDINVLKLFSSGDVDVAGLLNGVDVGVDVPLNTTHRTSDGSDHSDVVSNTTHRSSTGADHTFIDQDVTATSIPAFDRLSIGGVSVPANDASIDLKAIDKAFMVNRGTTVQRDAITPLASMQWYNTDTNDLEFFNGVAWQSLSGVEGPASSTDNAIARFNGSIGKIIQNSGVIIDDLDVMSGLTQLNVDNLRLDGRTLSSTDTNGDINVLPIGLGRIILGALPESPAVNWTLRSQSVSRSWEDVAFGNDVFVAFAQTGTTDTIMTSPDGINWTTRTAHQGDWVAGAYGNNTWIGVAQSGGGPKATRSIDDGVTWSSSPIIAGNNWKDIVFGNGFFVAVGFLLCATTSNGIAWTSRSIPGLNWRAVGFGNNLFVAVAQTGIGNRVATSPDGINWTSRTSAQDSQWSGVAYGNDIWVAVAQSGTNRVMTSPDGITWTIRTAAEQNSWFKVTFSEEEGIFVAVSENGTNRVMTSSDGITWTSQSAAAVSSWSGIAYGNGAFVAVARFAPAMTSGTVAKNILQGAFTSTGGFNATSGLTVNKIPVSKKAINTIEVFSLNDLPDPVVGIIDLVDGNYQFKADIDFGTTTLRIVNQGFVALSSVPPGGIIINYSGTGTFITATDSGTLQINDVVFTLDGNNSTFIFVDDMSDGLFWSGADVICSGTNNTIGSVGQSGSGCTWRFSALVGWAEGITFKDLSTLVMNTVILVSDFGVTGTGITLADTSGSTSIQNTNFFLSSTQNMFDFRPAVQSNVYIFVAVDNAGPANFFKSGTTGSITSFTDVSVSGVSVISVADNGSGQARFTSTAHGLVVGETVTNTGFADSTYNVTQEIIAADANTYDLDVVFTATGTGNFTTTTTQVNSTTHGLSNGDNVSIFGTVNFGGGYEIFNSQTNSYEISLGKAFPGTETGTWDTSSLDQTSKFVTMFANPPQKDSKTIGSMHVKANVTATVIATQNVFIDLDLGTALQSSNTELFTLVNTTTGEMRYDGLVPFSGTASIHMSIMAESASPAFRLRLIKNGVVLIDDIEAEVETPDSITVVGIGFSVPVTIVPDDLLRVQILNADGTNNVTVRYMTVSIQ